MATQDKLTNELKKILDYIRKNVVDMYPCDEIDAEHILLAILENKDCVAHRALSNTLVEESIDALSYIISDRLPHKPNQIEYDGPENIPYSRNVESAMESVMEKDGYVNSGSLLANLITTDKFIGQQFQKLRLTPQRFQVCVAREMKESFRDEIPEKVKEDKKGSKKDNSTIETPTTNIVHTPEKPQPQITAPTTYLGEMEKCLSNLNREAAFGRIQNVIEKEKTYRDIFQTLLKKSSNNVVLTGDSGCGKTAVARHIANMLAENTVPIPLRGKILLDLTLSTVLQLAGFRGMLEGKFRELADDVSRNGNIILIDDVAQILGARITETDTESLLETLAADDGVMLIITCSDKDYGKHIASSRLGKLFHRIHIEPPTDEAVWEAVRQNAEKLELYHNILYDEEILRLSINMAKNWGNGTNVIDAASNILDESGARIAVEQTEDPRIIKLKEQIDEWLFDKAYAQRRQTTEETEAEIAEIDRNISNAKAKIAKYEKEGAMRDAISITKEQFLSTASDYLGVDIEHVNADKKHMLRGLNDKITKDVIGQDKAVEEVCRVVRRKRVGLGNINKPTVLFFGGSTGTGKTYLAKKVAEHVFGSEKDMVRLDMSEYADKMSINKLYGSAHGYVGFENGGILTNAIRGKKNCVLLLDEIEKAHSDVFDVFLQVFDEGRLTDNKGKTVDFKDVIIIMTSNIGAAEVAERGKGIGFVCNEQSNTESIVKRALQRKFKPEFINRIDSIVFFNDLSDAQLKQIIGLEIDKIGQRLAVNGYSLDESLTDGRAVDYIDGILKKESEKYNARSIARAVQKYIEDKIVDYIIDNDVPDGHAFRYNEIVAVQP